MMRRVLAALGVLLLLLIGAAFIAWPRAEHLPSSSPQAWAPTAANIARGAYLAAVAAWRDGYLAELRASGIDYQLARTSAPLDATLLGWLGARARERCECRGELVGRGLRPAGPPRSGYCCRR